VLIPVLIILLAFSKCSFGSFQLSLSRSTELLL
jgi:hypothetical protein